MRSRRTVGIKVSAGLRRDVPSPYMSYSLKSLKGLHRGLCRGLLKGLLRGIAGVQTIIPLPPT